jgi:hypothetical protein
MMQTLIFNNADATPKTEVIRCDVASVRLIMEWYGGFFAGDRYTVTLDGRNVPMDNNGAPTEAAGLP